MSGIAGFISLTPRSTPSGADRARLQAMCEVMRHRGPDGEDAHVDGAIALGVRYLLAGDDAAAKKAATNGDGSVWAVLDGEVTNRRELQDQLATAAGRQLTGASNALTIVHAYEVWSESVFARLHGRFALALWDARQQTLLLARDRAGIKPLYYAIAAGRLFFGSEAKCLLANPEIDRQVDPAALDHYLAFLLTPRDRSIFRGIQKLLPAHYLKVHDGRQSVQRYWELPVGATFNGSEHEAADRLDDLLGRAIQSESDAAGDVGALLSGGVNSSVVAALLARATAGRAKTLSVAFGDSAPESLAECRRVAEHLGTEHHEIVVRPDASAILDRLVGHFDEPFADPSAIPLWYLSEAARAHVPAVLSGNGADELFGGCDRYLPPSRVAHFDRVGGRPGRLLAAAADRILPEGVPGRSFVRHVARNNRGRYLNAMMFAAASERQALLAPDLQRELTRWDAEASFGAPFGRLSRLPWGAQMMAFDFEVELPEDVLAKVDRMSMAHSLDWRLPLLHEPIVEFAASLPAAMKVAPGRLKPVLKALALRHLPATSGAAPAPGFGMSVDRWFATPMRNVFGDILGSPAARQRGYFNEGVVTRLLQEHLGGSRDHSMRLWQLLVFELWHRQYVGAPASSAA